MTPIWGMVVHLVVAGDVFDGVLFCAVLFPTGCLGMKSGTELSQFLSIPLPTLQLNFICSLQTKRKKKVYKFLVLPRLLKYVFPYFLRSTYSPSFMNLI